MERGDRAEDSAKRHKEAVAKLTADNMVFLMRLKESEAELITMRSEAAGLADIARHVIDTPCTPSYPR